MAKAEAMVAREVFKIPSYLEDDREVMHLLRMKSVQLRARKSLMSTINKLALRANDTQLREGPMRDLHHIHDCRTRDFSQDVIDGLRILPSHTSFRMVVGDKNSVDEQWLLHERAGQVAIRNEHSINEEFRPPGGG